MIRSRLVFGVLWKAIAIYSLSGSLIGAATGYFNWTNGGHSEALWQTMLFTTFAGAVW